jgi:hypothetical protein
MPHRDWRMDERAPLNDAIQVVVTALPDRWWDWSAYDLATRIVTALGLDYAPVPPNSVGSPASVGASASTGPSELSFSEDAGGPPRPSRASGDVIVP